MQKLHEDIQRLIWRKVFDGCLQDIPMGSYKMLKRKMHMELLLNVAAFSDKLIMFFCSNEYDPIECYYDDVKDNVKEQLKHQLLLNAEANEENDDDATDAIYDELYELQCEYEEKPFDRLPWLIEADREIILGNMREYLEIEE